MKTYLTSVVLGSRKDASYRKVTWAEVVEQMKNVGKAHRSINEEIGELLNNTSITRTRIEESSSEDIPAAIKNLNKAKNIKNKNVKLNNVKVIKAPESTEGFTNTVFLAGSIEMGKAVDWQTEIAVKCDGKLDKDKKLTLLNPRRDDWDSSWEQTIENDNFREQVEWELDSMEKADKIVIYIDPKTTSPITLLELGLHASDKMCVCCPKGFYRKGNVDIVCKRHNIPMVDDIDGLVKFILDETN